MVKVPGKPKQTATSYALFVKTCREEHKKKHPNESVNFADFSKRCSEKWKTMGEKEKKRFEDMSSKDRKRFEAEMAAWQPPAGETKGKKRKKVKDPNAPKRPMSAFFWFNGEERPKVRAEHPDWGIGQIGKELGLRWEKCTNKRKFEELSAKDRQRWEKEQAAYLKKGGAGGGGSSPAKKAKAPAAAQHDSDDDEDDSEEESD